MSGRFAKKKINCIIEIIILTDYRPLSRILRLSQVCSKERGEYYKRERNQKNQRILTQSIILIIFLKKFKKKFKHKNETIGLIYLRVNTTSDTKGTLLIYIYS